MISSINNKMIGLNSIEDWKFIGEGKLHIAVGNINKNSEFYGLVLVVVKHFNEVSTETNFTSMSFVKCVMNIWFSASYVSDKYEKVDLSDDFRSSLLHNIDKERLNVTRKCKTMHLRSFGYIQRNLCILYREIVCDQSSNNFTNRLPVHLSFEFKVKGGLKCCSPFIPESRLIKLSHSRFELIQLYKSNLSKVGSVNITTSFNTDSFNSPGVSEKCFSEKHRCNDGYHPQLLCSRQYHNVLSALRALMDRPNNNLKVTLTNINKENNCDCYQHIYGWGKNNREELNKSILDFMQFDFQPNALVTNGKRNNNFHCSSSSSTTTTTTTTTIDDDKYARNYSLATEINTNSILETLASILCSEDILNRLETMQKLDIIDTEGAAIIFRQLVMLLLKQRKHSNDRIDICSIVPTNSDICHNSCSHVRCNAIYDDDDYISIDSPRAISVTEAFLFEQMSLPLLYDFSSINMQNDNTSSSNSIDTTWMKQQQQHPSSLLLPLPTIVTRLKELQLNEFHSFEERKQRRELAIVLVTGTSSGSSSSSSEYAITIEECVLLLRMWMMALIAKDASILVTLQLLSTSSEHATTVVDSHNNNNNNNDSSSNSSVTTAIVMNPTMGKRITITKQDALHCGHACYSNDISISNYNNSTTTTVNNGVIVDRNATSNTSSVDDVLITNNTANNTALQQQQQKIEFAYTVGIIDIGLKSMDKIWKKDEEDEIMCRILSNTRSSIII